MRKTIQKPRVHNKLSVKKISDNRKKKITSLIYSLIDGEKKTVSPTYRMVSGLIHRYNQLGFDLLELFENINEKYVNEDNDDYVEVALSYNFLPLDRQIDINI